MMRFLITKNKFITQLGLMVLFCICFHPSIAQKIPQKVPQNDTSTEKIVLNDTSLPHIVSKVALYTATIDHTDFLIRRKYNISPIALVLPEIEGKIKDFKIRLEKQGAHLNFRSLNSGIIILQEILGNLTAYQNILNNFSTELTQSNAEVKKIIHDPILKVLISDSVVMDQLDDIHTEGLSLDSLQETTLSKVNLLRNRVSINLLQTSDIISDMRYLTLSLRLGMWGTEDAPLFKVKQGDYHNSFIDVSLNAIAISWKIIVIYLADKLDVLALGLLIFMSLFFWVWLNMRQIKKMADLGEVLQPVLFLKRSVIIGCGFALFTFLPFLFANPPMSFLHLCELFRLSLLGWLIYPYLQKTAKILWVLLSIIWFYYAMDDILLQSALGERWGLLIAAIILAVICFKIIFSKAPNFINLAESPVTKTLVVFTFAQVVFSLVFNILGRVSLAKIFGVSAIQCLMLGISLKVFSAMVLEAIYLQSEAYHDSRFSDFLNFKTLQYRFLRVLWILTGIVWIISLFRNLTLYDAMLQTLGNFFGATRTLGNMVFSFKNVAVFICIIWLSTVISGFINFFFGNEKLKEPGKRSRIGSMMLLIRLSIWTLGFSIAVAAAGIPLDKLSIMIGALGVGIGFGLQNIVNNLVSGVILAFERPIQVGDMIEVGDKSGVVIEIGVRSSKISNNEGANIIVPNGDLLSQHLTNWTMQDRKKQVDFILGISYETDLDKVKALVLDKLTIDEKILSSPAPSVVIQQFAERSIQLKIMFWVQDLTEATTIRSNTMMAIFDCLNEAGIRIPHTNDVKIP